jgi:transcription factor C subunit 6
MPRQLRARTSRPDYASLAAIDDEEDLKISPSKPSFDEDVDSESDFAPDKLSQDVPEDLQNDTEDLLEVDEEEAGEAPKRGKNQTPTTAGSRPISHLPSITGAKPSRKPRQKSQSAQASASKMSAPRAAKMYALPNPSVHHRHRAMPVLLRKEKVERLDAPPALFNPPNIVSTNSMTSEQFLTDRISKAWGYNVGPGPVWNIMEDRSCFKEALEGEENPINESFRRPRVHQSVEVRSGWTVLNEYDAARYLPSDTVLTDDGQLLPPAPVHCFLGPHSRQTRVEMAMFDSHATSEYSSGSKSFVFNVGSPAWGADWCPTYPDDRPRRGYKHYLAIAPFSSRSHSPMIGAKAQRPVPACIQIWSLQSKKGNGSQADGSLAGEMKCEMVLCLESGPAFEIKWCPLPSHDQWNEVHMGEHPRKLGLLAGTFEDGSLSVYVVPDPQDVSNKDDDPMRPTFVRLPEPLLRIELEETSCWSLDWANSEIIAVGCTNGFVAVYDIGHAVRTGQGPNMLPTHYISIHQCAVRALAWIRIPPTNGSGVSSTSEDPMFLATGGYDGLECLTDIREPHGNIVNRTRDVINSTTYSAFAGGPIMIDHDNTVKAYSVSPSTLGRGHVLLEPDGPVWSVSASDYHAQLAVGSADGSCVTTNTLKSTRRGGSVPFFVHKIFQLDYSRKTGEFRMLDHFLPQETQERSANSKGKQAKKDESETSISTGVWPPEVGVHRVTWNTGNGLAGAPLLASTTGSGLCRVDWLLGRWIRNKVPYVNVPNMRKEVDDMMDEDSGDD